MSLTPATLAFDIISRNKAKVQPAKYTPRGPQAEAVVRFMGRPAGHEVFITEAQAGLFAKLLGDASIITYGTGETRFAGFVRSIYSQAKGRNFYILCFCGCIGGQEEGQEEPNEDERWHPTDEISDEERGIVAPVASRPVVVPATNEQANRFAARLIQGAIEKGRHQKDSYARAGQDDYLIAWLSAAQADALMRLLADGVVREDGSFLTQAAGPFCYWGKKRTGTGAQLLCWMGEPPTVHDAPPAPKPVKAAAVVVPNGKRIPLDVDIPF
mgnify:CR=1 FL=1